MTNVLRPARTVFVSALALSAMAVAPPSPSDVILTIVPEQSTVSYRLGAVLHAVHGTLKVKDGQLRFKSDGEAAGDIVVDLTTGQSGDAKRDARMHRDILQSDKYPYAVFTAEHVDGRLAVDGVSHLNVTGVLLVHGDRHPFALPVDVTGEHGRLTARTQFTVPYVAWGMKNPSTFLLRVDDHVSIDVTAALTLRPATP